MSRGYRFARVLLLAIFSICVISQALIRPAVAIANNGDFPKVIGPFGLGPEDSWDNHPTFTDFFYTYYRDDRYYYNRQFVYFSSEYLYVKAARLAQKLLHPGLYFDIRWVGAMHALVYIAGFSLLMFALEPPWGIAAGILALVALTDVAYVQYLDSFYMDATAITMLLLSFGAAVHVVAGSARLSLRWLMIIAALLLSLSKSQHAMASLAFAAFFVYLAFYRERGLARWLSFGGAVALVASTIGMVTHDGVQYRAAAIYDVVFTRIALESPQPLETLRELGLSEKEAYMIGKHAYTPGLPVGDENWDREFLRRCGALTIVRYYLRHPQIFVALLYSGIARHASVATPFSNRSREDGFPPNARATPFSWWSGFRSTLLRFAPWHVLLLICALAGLSLLLFIRSAADRPFAALVLTLIAFGSLEYLVAEVGDTVEAGRHMLMFNMATDLMIVMLPALIWRFFRLRSRAKAEAGVPAYGHAALVR